MSEETPFADFEVSGLAEFGSADPKEIKAFLETAGYVFESQTDTETVAKLLDYYYDKEPLEAIIKVMAEIKGSYALGIMFRDYPDKIYAIRKRKTTSDNIKSGFVLKFFICQL